MDGSIRAWRSQYCSSIIIIALGIEPAAGRSLLPGKASRPAGQRSAQMAGKTIGSETF